MASDSTEILRRWYAGPYSELTVSANGSFFERYMHEAMESGLANRTDLNRVIELGANRGEHVPYVTHRYTDYIVSDLSEPSLLPTLVGDPRLTVMTCDAADVPLPDACVDRVVMTCVMHHVDSPLDTANEMRRLVRPGGVVSILVPTDPGVAYRWGKAATSGRLARRKGLATDLALVNAIAHHNHFRSIRTQLDYAFRDDSTQVAWRPFRAPSFNLNAFTVWQITKSR